MADSPRRPRFEIRRAFLRGLAVLLPSVLTLWLLVTAYDFVNRNIAEPINGLARSALAWSSTAPGPLNGRFEPTDAAIAAAVAEQSNSRRPLSGDAIRAQLRANEVAAWWEQAWYLHLFGLIVALVVVYVAGRFVGGWLGRSMFAVAERLLLSLPIIKQIYPSIKQIVGFFLSDGSSAERSIKFNRVVLVEYPRKGLWSVGLLTGNAMRSIEAQSGEAVTVFIPGTPPFTGWTVTAPRDGIHELPITIDEALRFLVSGGVLVPPHQEGPSRDPLPQSPISSVNGGTLAGS
ncbi:MAG: DUF502 domain-containing protein [Phycisphaerales bacterium]